MSHLQTPSIHNSSSSLHTLSTLPKSNIFTSNLPPDPEFPTPESSHNASRDRLGPRLVNNALYTYVRPEITHSPELLAVSPAALRDLGLKEEEAKTDEFKQVFAGNKLLTWDEEKKEGIYPWAQCYGGYQFGEWAGQLGDGRAISLFESINSDTGTRYEVQLKGAGKTPYSRFADGKAVLRSSIREFVVSEYLNAIGIPSTRALALTLAPRSKVLRERLEPGAIVTRFAQSWIRIGTFDLPRMRRDRNLLRTLADYTAEHVYGGWDKLPGKLPGDATETWSNVTTGLAKDVVEGPPGEEENRYVRLYRAIVRANARTVARWQAYGFMNGVLNTDNTSILGLSLDFGPFAFLDQFDPNYTPNHDDYMLRYSYKNQPTMIWWNLVRLGEALGEHLGAAGAVDDADFLNTGIRQDALPAMVKRAEDAIARAGDEYKAVFLATYKQLMASRLGLKSFKESDFAELFSELLDVLEKYELDFHHAFRRLSGVKLANLQTEEQRRNVAGIFFRADAAPRTEDESRTRIAKWFDSWAARVREDWSDSVQAEEERMAAMAKMNPKFVPRSWILDEIIQRVEKKGDREILDHILKLNLNPFEESWGWNESEEERFCGDVPKYKSMMQCSCSS